MAYVGAAPELVDFVKDIFSGNGTQTIFNMSVAPATEANCLVIIGNGNTATVAQPNAYTVSGQSLVFSTAPVFGANNVVVLHLGQAAVTAGITRIGFGSTGFSPTIPTFHDLTLSGILSVANGGLGNAARTATNVSGVVAPANGGTGITNAGTQGNVLRSNGTSWASFDRVVLSIGSWTIQETANGRLTFINGGTNRLSLADTGLTTAASNITGRGTP